MGTVPSLLCRVDDRPWLVHLFREHPPASLSERWPGLRQLLRTRPRDSVVALVVPSAAWVDSLSKRYTAATVALLRLAGVRPVATRKVDAGAVLGLHPDLRVALVFGTHIPEHDPLTVVRALERLEDWQLLVVGSVNYLIDDRLPDLDSRARMVRIPRTVSEEVRDLAYRAADACVLSFAAGYSLNSGTLMDALSYGKPVVVSTPSAPANVVAQHGIGDSFESGDAGSLARTLRRLDRDSLVAPIAAAQAALSNRSVAEAHLELLNDLAQGSAERLSGWALSMRP
jgi:glycosyltransferase involved in cell wall biosynthesis